MAGISRRRALLHEGVFDSYTNFTAGGIPHFDDVFDNLPAIAGRKPITLAEFARKHADKFRY
jgi:NAD(P)H dehydrogenase (quinone)